MSVSVLEDVGAFGDIFDFRRRLTGWTNFSIENRSRIESLELTVQALDPTGVGDLLTKLTALKDSTNLALTGFDTRISRNEGDIQRLRLDLGLIPDIEVPDISALNIRVTGVENKLATYPAANQLPTITQLGDAFNEANKMLQENYQLKAGIPSAVSQFNLSPIGIGSIGQVLSLIEIPYPDLVAVITQGIPLSQAPQLKDRLPNLMQYRIPEFINALSIKLDVVLSQLSEATQEELRKVNIQFGAIQDNLRSVIDQEIANINSDLEVFKQGLERSIKDVEGTIRLDLLEQIDVQIAPLSFDIGKVSDRVQGVQDFVADTRTGLSDLTQDFSDFARNIGGEIEGAMANLGIEVNEPGGRSHGKDVSNNWNGISGILDTAMKNATGGHSAMVQSLNPDWTKPSRWTEADGDNYTITGPSGTTYKYNFTLRYFGFFVAIGVSKKEEKVSPSKFEKDIPYQYAMHMTLLRLEDLGRAAGQSVQNMILALKNFFATLPDMFGGVGNMFGDIVPKFEIPSLAVPSFV